MDDDGVIWSSASGAHVSKTIFEFRENGYHFNSGGSIFGKFISKEEALQLAEAILRDLELGNRMK